MSYLDLAKKAERELKDRGDDPVVTRDIMMEEFRRLQGKILGSELSDFDYEWLRANRLDLYGAIKAKEAEMEATEGQPLSILLETIREWIELVRESYREQTNASCQPSLL